MDMFNVVPPIANSDPVQKQTSDGSEGGKYVWWLIIVFFVLLVITILYYYCRGWLIRIQDNEERSRRGGLDLREIELFPTSSYLSRETKSLVDEVWGSDERDHEDIESCAICSSRFKFGEMIRTLPCSHFYHTDCVNKWLMTRATCPLCRRNFSQ